MDAGARLAGVNVSETADLGFSHTEASRVYPKWYAQKKKSLPGLQAESSC